jgi:hypothetical protein
MNIEPGIYRPEFPMDGNFTMVPNSLIRDTEITPTGKLLLIYLLSHKIGYHILDDQIMRETGLGRHALRTARSHLEELGFIEVARVRNDDQSWGGYRYELADPRGYFSTVDYPTVERSTVDSSTVGNPPDNIKLIPKKTTSNKTKVDKTMDFDFNEFWSIYPRQQGRGKAKEAFIKAVTEFGLEPVMSGVRRYAADPNLPDPQFIPLPTTWLNQERWADGPLPLNRKLTNSERNLLNFANKMTTTNQKEVEDGQEPSASVASFGINLRSADSV